MSDLVDGQIQQLKKRFLDRFRKEGNVSQSVKGICDRGTVYNWKTNDPDFAAAWVVAELEATEVLEHEATRRAVKGVKRTKGVYYEGQRIAEETEINYSDTLLIFLLKARAPQKYRERVDVNHAGSINSGDSLTSAERAAFRAFVLERDEPRLP